MAKRTIPLRSCRFQVRKGERAMKALRPVGFPVVLGLLVWVGVVVPPAAAAAAPAGAASVVTATIRVGGLPLAAAVNPKTDNIYVANTNDDTVSVINGR